MHGFDWSFSGAFKTFDCCRYVAEDTLPRKSCASFPHPNFGFSLPNVANWFSLPLNQTCLRPFFHTPQWLKARERSRAADKSKFLRYSCGGCFFFVFETTFYAISQTVSFTFIIRVHQRKSLGLGRCSFSQASASDKVR